jgi:hypothetical protein
MDIPKYPLHKGGYGEGGGGTPYGGSGMWGRPPLLKTRNKTNLDSKIFFLVWSIMIIFVCG